MRSRRPCLRMEGALVADHARRCAHSMGHGGDVAALPHSRTARPSPLCNLNRRRPVKELVQCFRAQAVGPAREANMYHARGRDRGDNMKANRTRVAKTFSAKTVLVVDVGGTSVKILATGQTERRSFPSGPTLTPRLMVSGVKELARGWTYDRISIGYPGPVLHGRPIAEPYNLGRGWVGFDFAKAFGCPVKIVNDAAMQALGSYNGG